MDHTLMASTVRITPKSLNHSKKKGCPRINTSCANNSKKTQQFISRLEDALSEGVTTDDTVGSKWTRLRDTVYNFTITAYWKKERKNADWYEAHWEEMEPVTQAKRKALLAFKAKPSPSTLQALRAARNKAHQTARHCANNCWLNLCSSIQEAADTGNTRDVREHQEGNRPNFIQDLPPQVQDS